MSNVLQRRQFVLVALFFQLAFTVLFAFFGRYHPNALPGGSPSRVYVNTDYPLFQDIHMMIFIGFGFLMAFLKRYGFSAVSMNMMLSAFIIQWAMLLRGVLSDSFLTKGTFTISINELMTADFSALVVLITMGVLLGKLTPVQFLLLGFIETSFAILIEHILFNILHVNDGGRSYSVHIFGAYFGLAASCVGSQKKVMDTTGVDGSIHHSDLFSMIGTLCLWIFWPSFNAAVQEPEDARHRAIMNTYLSMASCTLITFVFSSLVDRLGRFNMMHVQNSTLAGGVAIGSVANVILFPYHAVIVGSVAGFVSVLGHVYITPKLLEKIGIYDTCGVHNLHGLPGVLSGLFSVIFVMSYNPDIYGKSIHTIYPYWQGGIKGGNRDALIQALFQLGGLVVAIVSAIFGGMLTGLILRIPLWNQVSDEEYYGEPNYFGANVYDLMNKQFTIAADRDIDDSIDLAEHNRSLHTTEVY